MKKILFMLILLVSMLCFSAEKECTGSWCKYEAAKELAKTGDTVGSNKIAEEEISLSTVPNRCMIALHLLIANNYLVQKDLRQSSNFFLSAYNLNKEDKSIGKAAFWQKMNYADTTLKSCKKNTCDKNQMEELHAIYQLLKLPHNFGVEQNKVIEQNIKYGLSLTR